MYEDAEKAERWIFEKVEKAEKLKSRRAEKAEKGEQFLWLHICWNSRAKVENVSIRMNGEMPSKLLPFFKEM